jgi:hypothetical protein
MLLQDVDKEPGVKQIRFDAAVENGVNVYRYLAGDDVPVEAHWAGLYQEWPEGPTPWTEYAVNNNNTEEIAVYLGLVWRMTAGLARYGIATYFRDEASVRLHQEPRLIDWEYEVDAKEPDPGRRDHGFVPARSCVPIRPAPTLWQSEHAAQAGMFSIAEPRDLVELLRAIVFDASAEVVIFGVEPGPDRLTTLTRSLSGTTRPSLAAVLRPKDVFIDLTVGVDLGYSDSITIASYSDLTVRLRHLADDYDQRIADYEAKIGGLLGIPAFLAAMQDLTGMGAR